MIWTLLWAAGGVALLLFIFRGRLGWLILWALGLVAVIASALVQDALLERRAFRDVVETVSQAGLAVLVVAVTVLVADLAAMIVYTIRHGTSDHRKGTVVTENRVIGSISPFAPGVSKLRMLGSKSGVTTMESLLGGTATRGERMMAAGILTSMIAFFLIFVGAGLLLMKHLLILALMPVIPGLWLYKIVSDVWRDYREAKKRVAARRRGEQAAAVSERPHEPHRERTKQS